MVKAAVLVRFTWLVMAMSIPWLASAQQVQSPSPPPVDQPHQHSAQAHADLFPAREASGTSWLPDETPMYGVQRRWRGFHAVEGAVVHGVKTWVRTFADSYLCGGAR